MRCQDVHLLNMGGVQVAILSGLSKEGSGESASMEELSVIGES